MALRTQSRPPLRTLSIILSVAAVILWLLPLLVKSPVLFPPGPAFIDIFVYKGRFTVYHSLKFFTSRAFSAFAYPPGGAPIYAAFYATADSVQTYLTLAAVSSITAIIAACLYLRRHAASHLIPLLLLCSFPLVFLVQRANIEIILWIVIALGILVYLRGYAILAAFLFGLAASVKLYPIFLLGLFLKRKQDTPAFLVGLTTAVMALLAACAYSGPTLLVAANGFTHGIGSFQDHYIDKVSKVEVIFDHSLFSPLKYSAFQQHTSPAAWTHTYYLVAGTFALLLFLRIRSFPALNRIVFLLVAMVCLPPVSFTYTLVHLYLPALLLCAALCSPRTPPTTAVATLALLLFITLPLPSLTVLLPGYSASQPFPCGPLQSLCLLAVLILTTLKPWPTTTLPSTL